MATLISTRDKSIIIVIISNLKGNEAQFILLMTNESIYAGKLNFSTLPNGEFFSDISRLHSFFAIMLEASELQHIH